MLRSYQGIAPRIHDSCYIDESAQIIGDVKIGENSSVWMNAVVRGDVYAIRIGENTNVQDCSVLHGMRHKYNVIMGDWVTIGHRSRCTDAPSTTAASSAWAGDSEQCADRRRLHIAAGTVIPRNGGRTVLAVDGRPGKFKRKLTTRKRNKGS